MTLESSKAIVDAITESTKQQIEANRTSITNQLDSADRILLRKAADSVVQLSQLQQGNPT